MRCEIDDGASRGESDQKIASVRDSDEGKNSERRPGAKGRISEIQPMERESELKGLVGRRDKVGVCLNLCARTVLLTPSYNFKDARTMGLHVNAHHP